MTLSGRFVVAAILVIEIEEVFDERIASAAVIRSSFSNICLLISKLSVTASTTNEHPSRSFRFIDVLMRSKTSVFCSSVIVSFFTNRSRLLPILANPRATRSASTSHITTSNPAPAAVWAMPLPIVPAPITPIISLIIYCLTS